MNHALLVQILADLRTLLTLRALVDVEGRQCVALVLDDTEAEALTHRIGSVLADLSRVRRIPVEVGTTDLVDSHDTPSGLPVVATIHGPHELGRALPGAAVLEITGPPAPRKS